ncbi:M24 family metallopeptidase [Oceanobacillus halotolerans]|uniref:M24 family metallopeptidase n=1 Tax=Oceanobacillus halotolerans TaxID=2663380 RepID=UPI0013DA52B4|nr:Xaa-Pro peptidase family protein [Oceanobacillus halotolerans]
MTNRIDTLLSEVKKQNLDSILITSKANVYYLSNYYTDPHERVIAVYVSENLDPVLVVPAMEVEDAKAAGWSHKLIGYHDHENPWQMLLTYLQSAEKLPQSMGLEHDHVTIERLHAIKEILPNTELIDAQEIISNMRVIKSEKEYQLLKEAAALADFGIKTGVQAVREGVRELDIIATIEYELKKQGIQQMSFTTMTLSGAKASSPHGTPGMKEITSGDMVLFDLGVIYEGYCSDITRTVAFKSITDEQKTIYNTVKEAEEKAFQASQIGTSVGQIDLAAREHIEAAGYGKYFTHRIGHGIGIETHEYPSMHSNNKLPLQKGMCFTIEPGIYVPNKGGVRIEDMVYIGENGPEALTKYPKELQIID